METQDLFQYIIPIIFFIVWVIGKAFAGKKEDSEKVKPSNTSEEPKDLLFEDTYPLEEYFEKAQVPHKPQEPIFKKQSSKDRIFHHPLEIVIDDSKVIRPEEVPLRRLLQDPNSVKKAFLTAEILGTPIALRQNGKMGPCWNQ